MCYERWARRRDEAVESMWLRSLYSREPDDQLQTDLVSSPAETTPQADELTEQDSLEPIGAT
jgi:TorA maturation chaperone TorD